jgi:tRNA threonylcarbamoyladenosine biosynthesis protein TsaE
MNDDAVGGKFPDELSETLGTFQAEKLLTMSTDMRIVTESREQTVALGRFLGVRLPRNTIVCLEGDLGAGKTALAEGLAVGIGCLGAVSSPTFTLLIEHEPSLSGLAMYHFDAYRLTGGEEFLSLGFDEYFAGNGVCVIEWSNRVRSVLPNGCLMINLTLTTPDRLDERLIRLNWPGHENLFRDLEQWQKERCPC